MSDDHNVKCEHCSRMPYQGHHPDCPNGEAAIAKAAADSQKATESNLELAAIGYGVTAEQEVGLAPAEVLADAFAAGAHWWRDHSKDAS